MIERFEQLFGQARPAFSQQRTFARAKTLAISSLIGLGRRTVSGLLCTGGQQFADWSAAYRLFEKERFDRNALFAPARRECVEALAKDDPVVVMMDDTLIRKRGRKVSGAGWKRDPLGPPFCTNFVCGQRFLQISAALPEQGGIGRARGIPIDLTHAPSPKKPRKNASDEDWNEYRLRQQKTKISVVGAQRLRELRGQLNAEQGENKRRLVVAVDGGFTNRTVFRDAPENTVLIGRIRKDARLFLAPTPLEKPRRGRCRWYGEPLPTPEQIRRDDTIPWITVDAYGAGKVHQFEVKTLERVRWLGTGPRDARVVIVRPLAYRPRKGAHLLYRDPAYLLCTDPQLPLDRLLQAYLWRWEIELNFREEKTLLGVGEAQVRNKSSVEAVPALIVAAYAFLLLSAHAARPFDQVLPLPKWRPNDSGERCSTARLVGLMRSQLWGKAMGLNLRPFEQRNRTKTNPVLFENTLQSAVCYAFR